MTSKPQHERAVAAGLAQKGLESYVPLYWSVRRWSDRTKRLQAPLFPGYLFCRIERGRRQPVLQMPGVRAIVSFGAEMVPVPEDDLDRIRRMLASGLPVEPWPFLKPGQRVRVQGGPLASLEGTLAEVRNTWRVVVTIEMLQRSVAVQMDRELIGPA